MNKSKQKEKMGLRQLYRTDLLLLCREVLGYSDVSQEVHGPILESLQKFKGGVDEETVTITPKGKEFTTYEYRPACELQELKCQDGGYDRRLLILYPRGHLKTTIITIAHTIQWIINYPDIRILISTATGDQAQKIMREIRGHFQFNPYFRFLYPEFCPPDAKVMDWGNRTEFEVPCRKRHSKEPTVWICTVGKTIAGVHPDVIKSSDLVDKENIKTPGGINEVISHFRFMNPLLERYNEIPERDVPSTTGWNDVEGTRYDYGDLYGVLIKAGWKHVLRSCYSDENEQTPIWKSRFSKESLEQTRREMGDWEFAANYLNKCVPSGDGLCDPRDVAFIPKDVIGGIIPRMRLHCTIDLHGMEDTRRSDNTVLTIGGFDYDGRLYVIEIRCGRFSPENVIDHIFDIHKRYGGMQGMSFSIEKEAHARVLLPFLKREMSKRNRYPVMVPLKRDTGTSKQHRIRGLRPWFKAGIIRFSQDIPIHIKAELLEEIAQFPSQSAGVHDDILDTLADMMQNAEGGVTDDVIADQQEGKFDAFGKPRPADRFLGFDEWGNQRWLYGTDGNEGPKSKASDITGFLN